jgi:hypothetical protein
MPVIHAPRGLRLAARAAVAVAVAVVLLAYMSGPATAARPTVADSTAEVQAAKARLLAAVEPCSTRVPRNDVVALGQCAQDLAVPNAEAHGIIDLINTFLHCLRLQWANGTWDGPYPTIGTCMQVHGY